MAFFRYKPRFSVNLLAGVWPPCWATPRSRRRRAYAPTSNTASHDNHEKIHLWVSFPFPYGFGAPLCGTLGRQSSAKTKQTLIEHSESTFYYPDEKIFQENREFKVISQTNCYRTGRRKQPGRN